MHTLARGRSLRNREPGPPLGRRANTARREAAAAVRADIVQVVVDAVGAEGALERADARKGRRGRQRSLSHHSQFGRSSKAIANSYFRQNTPASAVLRWLIERFDQQACETIPEYLGRALPPPRLMMKFDSTISDAAVLQDRPGDRGPCHRSLAAWTQIMLITPCTCPRSRSGTASPAGRPESDAHRRRR